MGNKTLEAKAKEVLNDREKEIIDFFNAHDLNKASKNEIRNMNFPLIKKYYPPENKQKIYLEIFNIPALFKENQGFIFTINKLSIYIFEFKKKYDKENTTKKEINEKFEEFLKAIIEVKVEKINKILDVKIDKKDLIKLKQGIEKLYQYFGPDTVKSYYNKIIGVGFFGLKGTMAGVLHAISSGFSISGIVISAAVGCAAGLGFAIVIGLIGYWIYEYYKKIKDNNNILSNSEYINKFFEEIEGFKVESLNDNNLLVLALNNDINKREIAIFPYNLDKINNSICPIIGPNADSSSNSFMYYTYLDATEFFIDKYSKKIKEESYYTIIQELEKDFEFLTTKTVAEISYKIIKERNGENNNYEERNNSTITNTKTNNFADQLPHANNSPINQNEAIYTLYTI